MSPRFIVGHGLQHEGRAKCRCGALSDFLPSTAARKRWHKEHKRAVQEVLDRG